MSIFALLSLLSCVVSFLLGNLVFYKSKRNALNITFTLFCILLSFWGFTEFMCRQADSFNTAYLWQKVSSLWPFTISILIHFVLIFTERIKSLKNKSIYVLIYMPALIFFIIDLSTNLISTGPMKEWWGYTYGIPERSLLYFIATFWALGIILLVIFLLVRYYLIASDKLKKKQIQFVIIGFSLPALSAFAEVVPYAVFEIRIPEFTLTSLVWMAVFFVYAIKKYELFALTPVNAIESIVHTMPDSLFLADSNGRILMTNQILLNLLKYEKDELMGKSVSTLFASQKVFDGKMSAELLKTKSVMSYETKYKTKYGKIIPVIFSCSAVRGRSGKVYGIVGIARDITERKKIEGDLATEKERLKVTLRSIGDGVIAVDTEERVILMNKVAEGLTGCSEKDAVGEPIDKVFHIIDWETDNVGKNPIGDVMDSGMITSFSDNTILIAKDGTKRVIADSVAPIRDKDSKIVGAVLVFRDISEKQRMERDLMRIQKLDSVSILASGIAHDFNNILTAISGNISLAKMEITPDNEVFDILSEIEKVAIQAKKLTQQLIAFSKGGSPIKKVTSISKLLRDSVTFALRGSNVKSEFFIADDLWTVEVDEEQISQVINNLVINAEQAMPQGGKIEIKTENIVIEKDQILPLKKGKYIKFSIKDYGIGIPSENLTKIFDPYFTTKKKGNGLGLSMSYYIIKKHNGYITVDSTLEVGTTFYVYLPSSECKFEVKEKESKYILKGKGRILVMDDEDVVRKVAGKMLEHLGYKVEFAKNGNEAIEMYKNANELGRSFDVVIMDLTIPGGFGGRDAIKKLIKIAPEIKAIVSSGYSTDPVMIDFKKYGFVGAIAKPYKIEELSELLHQVIEPHE